MSEFKGTRGDVKYYKKTNCPTRLEAEANAKLIACAPLMLDMLIKINNFIIENENINYKVRLLSREVFDIKQLIKKATLLAQLKNAH